MPNTKNILLILILIIINTIDLSAQYIPNPSFEGSPSEDTPPPFWHICHPMSTPNTLPGVFGYTNSASDGATFICLIIRGDANTHANTCEDTRTTLITPLSPDTCYLFSIDLKHDTSIHIPNHPVELNPVNLKIYGDGAFCAKQNVLWESGAIMNSEWETFTFLVQPEFPISELILEVNYLQLPTYFGHIMVDNIVIEPTPVMELGNDTTLSLCPGESFPIGPDGDYNGYLWQDGSIDSVYYVTESGEYWLSVSDTYGCTALDTIAIELLEYQEMVSGLDEVIHHCGTESTELTIEITGGIPPYSYLWSPGYDGDTLATIFVTPTVDTRYYVSVSDQCEYFINDSVLVEVYDAISIDLGSDTTICYDNVFALSPGNFEEYNWQDGSSGFDFQVFETGYYSVTVTDYHGCVASDEIFVRVGEKIDLGQDSSICHGDTIILSASTDYDWYVWTRYNEIIYHTNEIKVFEEGLYILTAGMDSINCSSIDSIYLEEIAIPDVKLKDTIICGSETYTLSVESDSTFNYFWNDIQGTHEFTTSESGIYRVKVGNQCGIKLDTVELSFHPLPDVDIGDYFLLEEEGASVLLETDDDYLSYLWQDGSSHSSYYVSYEEALINGVYYVEVFDGNCYNVDSVIVEVGRILVPNVLTPNMDGYNDVFKPYKWGKIVNHTIIVFDRWGDRVWQSKDFPRGWDGTNDAGKKVPDGTYYWVLSFQFANGISRLQKGSLTILGN